MFLRLAVLFVTIPILELALLVWVGGRLGFWPTMALVIITGVVGATLARLAGLDVLARMRGELLAGRMPVTHMLDGFLVLLGGVVLLTPGFLTDLLGLALLLPGTRHIARRLLQQRLERMVASGTVVLGGFGARHGSHEPGGRDVGSDDEARPRPHGRDVGGRDVGRDIGRDAGGRDVGE